MDPDAPAPKGKVFKCWMNGHDEPKDEVIKGDTTFTAEYVPESEAVTPEGLKIYPTEDPATVQLSSGFYPVTKSHNVDPYAPLTLDALAIVEPEYPEVTNPRIRWTSSDDAVASVDEVKHRLVLNGGGKVTITGTLYNGISASFALTVDGPPAQYTIRFLDDDKETELQSMKVPRGDMPAYTGETPTKAATATHSYEFAGWTPEVVPVTGNAEYRATYVEKAKPVVYESKSGAGSAWTEGSSEPLVFVFKRTVDDGTTIEHFVGIDVDGEPVPETDASGRVNYTVEIGSVIISLQPAYLATLAPGEHRLKAYFDDGDAVEITFKTPARGESADSKGDGKKGSKDETKDEKNAGNSGRTSLPRTGDAPSGIVACLVAAAVCTLLLAGLIRTRRSHHDR